MAVLNTLAYLPTVHVKDVNGTVVTGKVSGDWTKTLIANGATSAVAVTVTETTSGFYTPSLTPDSTGDWSLILTIAVNGESYDVPLAFKVLTAAQFDPAAYLAASGVTVVSPVATNGDVTLYQSADYADAEDRSLEWSTTDAATWPTLTGATISFVAVNAIDRRIAISVAGSVVVGTGADKLVRVEFEPEDTDGKPAGAYDYQLWATLTNTHEIPLQAATLTLTARLEAD